MNKSAPWDEIQTPRTDFTVVRVPNTTGVPIYWGRDTSAQCLLILELTGDFTDQLRRDGVSLNGIGVDIRLGDKPGQQRFVLTLARHIDSDLFLGLCATLIDSLRDIGSSPTALAVALAHLKRWKAFLSGRHARLLSPEEVRGLFAELQILRRLYRDTLSQSEAVDAWGGPDDTHQDFIFANRAIEVKSVSGRDRSSIRISSEDQLESLSDELFLLTQRLSEMPDADAALSLNELVSEIEGELSDADAIEAFSSKLSGMSYAPLKSYDFPRFVVSGGQSYRVVNDFPRLIRSELPTGIMKVKYDLKMEAIVQFACDDTELFRRP